MTVDIRVGDSLDILRTMPSDSVHCVVTSPPYWGLRDYGVPGQLGLEQSPAEFISKMVEVFEEVRRVLRPDGTCWVNMGDSYATSGGPPTTSGVPGVPSSWTNRSQDFRTNPQGILKPKDLCMMPHRLATALQAGYSTCTCCEIERHNDQYPLHNGHRVCLAGILAGNAEGKVIASKPGWYVRQDIVWAKPNPMPESVTDRCTKSHEYIFLLTKTGKYYFNQEAISEPVSANTHARLSQDVQNQIGSTRVPGKTNGNMKAVGSRKLHVTTGVGFGRGYDAITKPRVKNNASFDAAMAIMPDTRNKRSVWTMVTQSFKEAHFATFPTELPETCIKAGCPPGGLVLDPFFGAGTTGLVADRLQRDCIGIELNPAYAEIARKRIQAESTLFAVVQVTA